jgi:hypothetical protein
MTGLGFKRSDKVAVGLGGGIMVPAIIFMLSTVMVPSLHAPFACGCVDPRIELDAVPFGAQDGSNGGGWVVTVRGSASLQDIYQMNIKIIDRMNNTIERLVGFTLRGPVVGDKMENATLYLPTVSVKVEKFNMSWASLDDLKALQGVGAVYVSGYNSESLLQGDMFIIFRDFDTDGKVDIHDGAHLEVIKHLREDTEHYSKDYQLGEVLLQWAIEMGPINEQSETH